MNVGLKSALFFATRIMYQKSIRVRSIWLKVIYFFYFTGLLMVLFGISHHTTADCSVGYKNGKKCNKKSWLCWMITSNWLSLRFSLLVPVVTFKIFIKKKYWDLAPLRFALFSYFIPLWQRVKVQCKWSMDYCRLVLERIWC